MSYERLLCSHRFNEAQCSVWKLQSFREQCKESKFNIANSLIKQTTILEEEIRQSASCRGTVASKSLCTPLVHASTCARFLGPFLVIRAQHVDTQWRKCWMWITRNRSRNQCTKFQQKLEPYLLLLDEQALIECCASSVENMYLFSIIIFWQNTPPNSSGYGDTCNS